MFCHNCGSVHTEAASYCHQCGAKLINKRQTVENHASNTANLPAEGLSPVRIYYSVPVSKFIILSILTLGLYDLYWFGKNWTLIQTQERSKISPVARAIFSIFFMSDLATRVLKTATSHKYPDSFSPTFLAIAYFFLCFTWRLPGQAWLIGFASIIPILPLVKAMRYVNEHEVGGKVDSSYHFGEIVFACIGGMILFFAIIGTMSM